MPTVRDLITNAHLEINVYSPGESIPAEEMQWAFSKLNRLMDRWSAKVQFAYDTNFNLFTLTPGLSPHLMGPAGASASMTVAQRPVKIVSARLVLNNTPTPTETPIAVVDSQWWADQPSKAVPSTVPTDLYYSPSFPLGQLFFWPVPQIAYQVRLEMWQLISQFASIDAIFFMPPAYEDAVTLTLAEILCPQFEKEPSGTLARDAEDARRAVWGNNNSSPRMATAVAGLGGSRNRNRYNYLNGTPW